LEVDLKAVSNVFENKWRAEEGNGRRGRREDERISGQIFEGRCIGTRGSRRVGFLKAWLLWSSAATGGRKRERVGDELGRILGDEKFGEV
jgi:hypothetical protein